jgi:hypothetical protein
MSRTGFWSSWPLESFGSPTAIVLDTFVELNQHITPAIGIPWEHDTPPFALKANRNHHPYSMSKRQPLGPSRVLPLIWTEAKEHGILLGDNRQSRSIRIGSGFRRHLAAWTSQRNSRLSSPPPWLKPIDRSALSFLADLGKLS